MKMSMTKESLIGLVQLQLKNNFGTENITIDKAIDITLARVEENFKHSQNKYYQKEGCYFSPFHSGQYSIFLYYLAHTVYKVENDSELASQIYYLNKILHSVDWYFEIELPNYFGVEHPLGTILGRADYSNGLFVYQGCTIGGGNAVNPKYPVLGENLILYANSKILGDSKIGKNIILAADTTIINEDIPDNSMVFGKSPNLIIKAKDEEYMERYMTNFWKNND